jgi:hypothetical protein
MSRLDKKLDFNINISRRLENYEEETTKYVKISETQIKK